MQPKLCSRCHKNVAVVFITKLDNNEPVNEGLWTVWGFPKRIWRD